MRHPFSPQIVVIAFSCLVRLLPVSFDLNHCYYTIHYRRNFDCHLIPFKRRFVYVGYFRHFLQMIATTAILNPIVDASSHITLERNWL